MRILIVHTRYTQHGGEDVVVEQEMDVLSKQHTVETLFFKNNTGLKGLFQFLFSIWNIKSANRVKSKIKEFKPDVVHIHNWHFASGPLVIRTISKLQIPLVLTLHNFRLLCPSANLMYGNNIFLKSLTQNFPWKAVSLGIYRNSVLQTFWLATVVWFHKKIKTWHKVNTYVCLADFSVKLFQESNLGIDEGRFFVKPNFTIPTLKLNTFEHKEHFLYIGRLCEEKGIKSLLEAFKALPFTLKIAGDGDLKDLVVKTTETHPNIQYLGKITNQDVAIQLQEAKALVFSSIWYEPFGLIVIEAFSNGCPVISSNIGAPATLVINNENGFHFKPADVEDLQLKIKELANLSKQDFMQMERKAYKTFTDFYSSENQPAYFDAIYKKAQLNKIL